MAANDDDDERDNNNWSLLIEALDRSLQEVEALQAIYFDDDDNNNIEIPNNDNKDESSANNNNNNKHHKTQTRFFLKSLDPTMETARQLVAEEEAEQQQQIPTLELEILLQVVLTEDAEEEHPVIIIIRLYFGLVPGYPSHEPVSVTVVTASGLGSRSVQEDLVCRLQGKAQQLVGSEAILELVHECQEYVLSMKMAASNNNQANNNQGNKQQSTHAEIAEQDLSQTNNTLTTTTPTLGRRWIWVHHITDRQRKAAIVSEAHDLNLGGYLKAGYPGIVVIEGPLQACNDFVVWIKGNKSRPGGFGRQWGHHVRGELAVEKQQLPKVFVALGDDNDNNNDNMSLLAAQCRDHGLEEEFLKFVLQHG